MTRKEQADQILYQYGLLDRLSAIGRPHIIGSYSMDMLAWNDLDIDVENDAMSLQKLHALSAFLLERFRPTWYEAKEETGAGGTPVWFHGFETKCCGDLWNVDIWFFDAGTIANAEAFCARTARRADARPGARDQIIRLKQALIARGLYTFDQYTSMDVYDAVLNRHISDIEAFLTQYTRPPKRPCL